MLVLPERPFISFTFDDFPRSAFLTGGGILNRYGLVGTYYVCLGLSGAHSPSGEMFVQSDLGTLLAQGHELGCHTFSHCHSWDTDTKQFKASVCKNRVALAELLPGAKFKSFSYPISPPRPLTKANIAQFFECCRGSGQKINAGTADLNQLSAFFLEQAKNNIEVIKNIVEHNRRSRGWLIFATHDVSDRPSQFGCTPEFFNTVVNCAVDSGACIMPVAKALEAIARESTSRPREMPRFGKEQSGY